MARFGSYRSIRMREEGGILEVRLHRDGEAAKWDIGNPGIHGDLGEAFGAIARDPDVRVVILTGTGEVFLTELDLGSDAPEPVDARSWQRIYREGVALLSNLLAIEVPTIAAVNGPAFIHAELPVLCDIVLAAEHALFADKAHYVAGVVPGDGVHVIWPMLLGLNRGRHFLLTGAEIGAREAHDFGIVAEVLPSSDLLPRAWTLARQIAAMPSQVSRFTRRMLVRELRRRLDADLSEGLMLEGMALLASEP